MVAGTTAGVLLDFPTTVRVPSVADVLEEKGKSWSTYQQNFPGGCYKGMWSSDYLYQSKHNPFISFPAISGNLTRCAHIKNADMLYNDVETDSVSDYVLCNCV
jgi:hypothetical protein